MLPLGSVTVFSTNHTMSLVSCATCCALNAMPGRSLYCCPKVMALVIKALYSCSSVV